MKDTVTYSRPRVVVSAKGSTYTRKPACLVVDTDVLMIHISPGGVGCDGGGVLEPFAWDVVVGIKPLKRSLHMKLLAEDVHPEKFTAVKAMKQVFEIVAQIPEQIKSAAEALEVRNVNVVDLSSIFTASETVH